MRSSNSSSISNDYDCTQSEDKYVDFLTDSNRENDIKVDIHVVHFDHRQRGEQSDGDRLFVEQLCNDAGVPFHCRYWGGNDTPSHHSNSVKFSQEVAREWRREESKKILQSIVNSRDIENVNHEIDRKGVIFTAHHRDDSYETMLLKVLRGVHLTNIAGMKVINTNDGQEPVARPLLGLRKSDLIDYLRQRRMTWREDSTNASNKYTRNRIRNELMPLLKDIVGGQDVLEQRLENIERQSTKIRNDLTVRANSYLLDSGTIDHDRKFSIDGEDIGPFILPQLEGNNHVLTLNQEYALHLWAQQRSKGMLILSQEKFHMVLNQLAKHPSKKIWKLNVGSGWNVERNGAVLDISDDSIDDNYDDNIEYPEKKW
eukprot:CAMPEP_0184869118 /NCGR_PEP_ID=MMETSP0580-20130426/32948_1 /TAXON_ID=1118495 /ORGANISM="Dactyliosolen fragilissimus" /LENGTH=370 /DNA_ID=CAMNT_0027370399 /DNA_START=697 /DNA_END=1806 /DNA_ORIENTATION=+